MNNTTNQGSKVNSFTGGAVRWLDDNTVGQATPERDTVTGLWLGTFTVVTKNRTTGGNRTDTGAILGMHIVAA